MAWRIKILTQSGVDLQADEFLAPRLYVAEARPCIAIPIHRATPRVAEIATLTQALSVLGQYPILLICPQSLDCSRYLHCAPKLHLLRFDDRFFENFRNHQRLMISAEFYKALLPYTHVLVYHLDAWVFQDKLDYWCRQPFDYIGAPWRSGFDANGNPVFGLSGNGGFSLRNIAACLKTIAAFDNRTYRNTSELLEELRVRGGFSRLKHLLALPLKIAGYRNRLRDAYERYEYTEDKFWAILASRANPAFRVAPTDIAKRFAFEASPAALYAELGNTLPFGCHAWRYEQDFWCNQIGLPKDPDFVPHDADGKPIDTASERAKPTDGKRSA